MHHVDAQRADLRELNELDFARFEARLAQVEATIVGRLEAKIEQRTADLGGQGVRSRDRPSRRIIFNRLA